MNMARNWFERQNFSWRELCILVVIGIVANLYFFTNYSPSIDDELAAVRSSSLVWIAQGRFTISAVETWLFPQPSLPFSPYLFLTVTLAMTHMLLVRAHGVGPSWQGYVAYCLFVSYPTWWLISEFSANVPATGIGFLAIAAALSLLAHQRDDLRGDWRAKMPRLLAIALLLAIAAGAYQTLLLLFATACVGISLFRSIGPDSRSDWRLVASQLVYGGICLVFGAILYYIINKLSLAATDTKPEYIDGFINLQNLHAPRWLAGALAKEGWEIYSGSAALFGASIPAGIMVVIFAAISLVLIARRNTPFALLLLLTVLGTPFLLGILTGPYGLPLRAMVALPYVFWLCALLILRCGRPALLFFSGFALILFQLQIVNLTSQYIAAANLAQQQDRMMAFEIGRQIGLLRNSNEIDEPIVIDTFGYTQRKRPSLYASADSSVTRGSFFGWDKGNLKRIVGYFHILGFDTIVPASDAARAGLTAEFLDMPVWPHEGALRRSGDYYLLKLGAIPDSAHDGSATQIRDSKNSVN